MMSEGHCSIFSFQEPTSPEDSAGAWLSAWRACFNRPCEPGAVAEPRERHVCKRKEQNFGGIKMNKEYIKEGFLWEPDHGAGREAKDGEGQHRRLGHRLEPRATGESLEVDTSNKNWKQRRPLHLFSVMSCLPKSVTKSCEKWFAGAKMTFPVRFRPFTKKGCPLAENASVRSGSGPACPAKHPGGPGPTMYRSSRDASIPDSGPRTVLARNIGSRMRRLSMGQSHVVVYGSSHTSSWWPSKRALNCSISSTRSALPKVARAYTLSSQASHAGPGLQEEPRTSMVFVCCRMRSSHCHLSSKVRSPGAGAEAVGQGNWGGMRRAREVWNLTAKGAGAKTQASFRWMVWKCEDSVPLHTPQH